MASVALEQRVRDQSTLYVAILIMSPVGAITTVDRVTTDALSAHGTWILPRVTQLIQVGVRHLETRPLP